MKFIKSSIVLAVLAAGGVAHAASATGQIQLSGAVSQVCTIAVTPTAKATNLDILTGETAAVVGTVTEDCNAGNGYTVSLTSANSGKLSSTATGSSPTTYTAAYDNGTGSIATKITADRNSHQFGRQGQVQVSFPGNSQAVAGSYTDTLNIVIAAK